MTEQKELIVHIHVPKTAGSTINAALAMALGPGREHVQGLLGDPAKFTEIAANSRWIAGHVPLPRMKTALAQASVRARYVTALRKPVAHVASHYNWLIEIGHRGHGFLKGHPPHIREIHHQIRTSDNSDPRAIIRNLEAHAGLFMNCQARHVIGPEYALAETSFARGLNAFETVVFSRDVKADLSRLFPGQSFDLKDRNTSRYHFDPQIFNHPELRIFLGDRNRADVALWTVANAKFRPTPVVAAQENAA